MENSTLSAIGRGQTLFGCIEAIVAQSALFLRRHIVGRRCRPRAEKELLHFRHQKFACFGIDRRKAILVDEHRLMLKPSLPSFFGYIGINTLAELAGVWLIIQSLGLLLKNDTMNGTWHEMRIVRVVNDGQSLHYRRSAVTCRMISVAGFAKPIRSGCKGSYQQ